jgi:hypothetical protein
MAFVTAIVAGIGMAATWAGGQPPLDDPLPLLRIALPPERLAQELARLKQGALVMLPRDEFETRVRKAAASNGVAIPGARLARAHYAAELSDRNLVQGRGTWTVLNPGSNPAPLSLSPLSLAISNANWEDGSRAVIGDIDGKGPTAWVDKAGTALLLFDWSCRGSATPQGLTFDVRVPPCPQTTMELKLPADSWPTIPPRAGLLTGPHDAGTPAKRLWKLHLAGKPQLELTVRRVPPVSPTLFVQTQTRQTIAPDRVLSEHEFQIEVPRGAIRELTLDADGSLEPVEVLARGAELDWRWDAPPGPKGKTAAPTGALTVEFREPQHGTIAGLRVRCVSPRPSTPADWVCPALRVRHAVCRSESLKIQVHANVHLERWQAGDFQLAGTAADTDGSLTLNLLDPRATLPTASARPRCQFATAGVEFATAQATQWQVDRDSTTLSCDIGYQVFRGQLHQLALKLPSNGAAFHVDAVDVEPRGLLRSSTAAGGLLLVELQRALIPGVDAKLSVRLRSRFVSARQPQDVDLPDLEPLGAIVREARYTVSVDPSLGIQLLKGSVPALAAADGPPLRADDRTAFVFAYRDRSLNGKVRVLGASSSSDRPRPGDAAAAIPRGQPAPGAFDRPSPLCASREWTTSLDADGTLTHLLRLRLLNWHEPRLVVSVAEPARAVAAKIDGSWLDRVEERLNNDHTRFTVPVIAGAGDQIVELAYSSAAANTGLGLLHSMCPAEPELPQLAHEPFTQRRYWRVPAEWTPLYRQRWRERGEPEGLRLRHALATLPERLWQSGDSLIRSWDARTSAWADLRRDEWQAAERAVRQQLGKGITVGAALAQLDKHLRETTPFIVDGEALRQAGITAQTVLPPAPVGQPFWVSLDLLAVACPGGVLLTTGPRLRDWQEQIGELEWLGEVLDPSVREAALLGIDHGGGFVSVDYWLHSTGVPTRAGATADRTRAFGLFAPIAPDGWREWEPLPGIVADDAMVLFNPGLGRTVGYIAAVAWLAGIVWLTRRRSNASFFRLHVLAVAALVLAMLWLPAPPRDLIVVPLFIAEAAALGIVFTMRAWPTRVKLRPSKSTMVQSTSVGLVFGIAILTIPIGAQQPTTVSEPQAVYLIPATEEARESVLVAPELLRKLDDLASRRPAAPAGGIVVAASYTGKVKDGLANVEARFELYHWGDKTPLVLPLTGVQLQPGVFLDGAPIFPIAHKGGYALPRPLAKGFHQLTLSFQVRAALENDYYEMRFGIPRPGQCQVELTWAAPARGLHLVSGLGDEKAQVDKKGETTLRAQLGHENQIHVRWPATQTLPMPTAIDVREAYIWDLRAANIGLTAGVQVNIARGSLPQMRFALPEGLEVRHVDLAGRPGTPAAVAAPTIRQWDVVGKDANRKLVIDFAQPIAGSFTLLIEMIPRLATTPGDWLLRLPAPLVGTSSAGILAYRVEGMEVVSSPQNLSVGTEIELAVLNERWAKLALREPAASTRILNFRRISPAAALGLAVQPLRPAAQVDAVWKVGAEAAELTAAVAVRSPAQELSLVELELPPRFTLARLSEADGGHIHHWSRQDRRVQVWLNKPRKQVELEVHGWVPHADKVPAARFGLEPLRVLQTRVLPSSVTIDTETGFAVEPQRVVRLTRIAKSNQLRYSCDGDQYEALFALRPAPLPAGASAFTLLERRGDSVNLSTALHVQSPPGELRVRLTGWTAGEPHLDTPAALVRKGHQHQGNTHVWTLQVPPGMPRVLTISLHGRVPAEALAKPWALPIVSLEPFPLQEYWVGLDGVESAGSDKVTIKPIASKEKRTFDFPSPPHELAAGAKVGRLKAMGDAPLFRLPPAATTTNAQPLFAHHDVFWSGRGWQHRLHILAFSGAQGELQVRLPHGGQGCAIAVGSRVFVPGDGPLLLPLPGSPGPREALVCWEYPDREINALPRLDPPEVTGLPVGAMVTRVWLTPNAGLASSLPAAAENAVEFLLKQAETHMQLCQRSASAHAPSEQLAFLQQRFRQCIDGLTGRIAGLRQVGDMTRVSELDRRAKDLVAENTRLAEEGRYKTASDGRGFGLAIGQPLDARERGLPVCWLSTGTMPQIALHASEDTLARSATELVLLIAVALMLLTYLRHVFVLFEVFWPELLLLLGGIGIWLAGWSLVGVLLLAVPIGVRTAWAVIVARRLVPGWFTAPPQDTGTAAAPPAAQ